MRKTLFAIFAMYAVSLSSFAQTTLSEVSFVKPLLKATPNTDVDIGPWVMYNSTYGHSWIMHANGQSWIEIEFQKDAEIQGPASLFIAHLSANVGKHNWAPVSIIINGKVLEDHYVPNNGNWIYDTWEIGEFLVDGKNKVRISLCNDAICNYWINSLRIIAEDVSRGRVQQRE